MKERAREREREEREEEEEEEEEEVEEVVDIFRAAPNQLLRQFVSVGVKERVRKEKCARVQTHTHTHTLKFNTENQYAAHSLTESSGQRERKRK